MSAPEVNIEKQKRRHRGPLIGMAVVVLFVVALILYWPSEETPTEVPQGTDLEIEGQGSPSSTAPQPGTDTQ
jgi:hypothetical protein